MKTVYFSIKNILILIVMGLVTACAGSDHSDLRVYISEVKQRPQGNIEPLPPVRTYDSFIYSATALRSPFNRPVETKVLVGSTNPNVKPDFRRPKDFLESFSLDGLSMVGTMQQKGQLWALVKYADGIERVTVGNFMGENHGKIISASATQLNLIEIVSDGLGGWVERPRTIKLSEKE